MLIFSPGLAQLKTNMEQGKDLRVEGMFKVEIPKGRLLFRRRSDVSGKSTECDFQHWTTFVSIDLMLQKAREKTEVLEDRERNKKRGDRNRSHFKKPFPTLALVMNILRQTQQRWKPNNCD